MKQTSGLHGARLVTEHRPVDGKALFLLLTTHAVNHHQIGARSLEPSGFGTTLNFNCTRTPLENVALFLAPMTPQGLALALKTALLLFSISWHNAAGFVHQLSIPSSSATPRNKPHLHELRMNTAAKSPKKVGYTTQHSTAGSNGEKNTVG